MLENSGFNATNTLRLIGTIEQIINIIYDNDDKYQSVWTDIKKFISSNDMMKFIRLFFKSIKNKNEKWIQYRKAKYVSVVNVLVDPNFIYQLDNSEYIRIKKRPGGKGFAAPGLCFIMQIECHNDNTFHGSLIHRDDDIENHEISHPKIFVTSNFMNNIFTVPLIEGYIENNRKNFKQFQKSYNYNQESSYINGLSCYYEQYGDKTIISYVTSVADDKDSEQLMKTAIKKVEKIIPYSPRTILVRNDVLKAIVAVTNIGANNFTSKVILYTDVNPIPYQVNEVTIDYLIDHIDELNSIDDHLVVAITGKNFSYLTEDEFNVFPNTSSGKPWVFMENSNYYSHLVILSDREIPTAKRIRWVDSKVHVTYSDVDALVQASNTLFRGIVQVSHDDDMIYTMNKKGKVFYDKKAKKNQEFSLDFRNMTQRSNVFRPIGCMFDRFAMENIAGNKLIKNIDLLGFHLSIPNKCKFADKFIKAISSFRRNGQEINPYVLIDKIPDSITNINPEEIKQELKILHSKINDAKQERDILYQEYNEPGTNKQLNKRKQENCKKQIKDLYDQVNMKKEQVQTYEQFIEKFCNDNADYFNSLIELKSISQRKSEYEINGLSTNYYLEFECNVDDREALLSTIKQITMLEPEVIPICNITINHDQASNLDKNQFEQKIKEICSKFGAVIKEEFDYQPLEKGYKGYKKIIIYTGEFSIPFAGEIRNAFGKIDKVQFKFPSKIIPSCLLNRLNVIECINKWISDNNLHFEKSGFKYYGNSNEISKAMVLLSKKETQPKIPFISHTIPGGIEIDKIVTSINQKNCKLSDGSKWGISRSSRLIYTPEDIDSETVQQFILKSSNKTTKKNVHKHEDGNNAIYDYSYYCEEKAVLSGCQIPIYQQDGTVQMKNFCITCGYDLFKNEVDHLFDAEEDMPKLDLLAENVDLVKFIPILEDENVHELWPQVPLGQLLWSLISEPAMNSVAKTWFSAIVYQALHCSQYLDYCPDHPSILLRVTGNQMKCSHPGCKMFLCNECNKWHKPGQCNKRMILPPGYRVCPWCNRAIEKTEACNRIACKCGKYFCYYCGFKGNTSNEIYEHLKTEHKGYFKNPPDYKKYYLHENVTTKELNEFYKKYPHIKALSSDIVKRQH